MEWSQVLAIVLPVMLTIIIGLFYNNRRIDDLRSNMNERFFDVNERFADMNQRIIDLAQQINRQFAELKTEIQENRSMLMQFLRKEAEL